ncbi:hypothetical protein NWH84_001214 [Salmonella enterica]|nr:hypothetical protein [Salmonella enterica]EJS8563865.1 hypothetical protein [Salmonella enterica]EJS8568718.1 hypothetical protein [Salmonella enterica]ELV5046086.1 hypothetical protein [Salmonella enterica]ELW8262193.1 hypothetical protein [Salmonella enterica]
MKTYRSKKWLAAVGQIEQCVLCGAWGTQVALKCMGVKTDDCAMAAICQECHHEIDNGSHLSREVRWCLMNRAIVLTVIKLVRCGLITPATIKE